MSAAEHLAFTDGEEDYFEVTPADWGTGDDPAKSCVVCGEEAGYGCIVCDADLCDDHARTTSVPGDTFCRDSDACEARYRARHPR
jgi:hypothetical protein